MASYYDIDAILTDSQKVPCTFELTVPGLGFIDGNAGQDVGHLLHTASHDPPTDVIDSSSRGQK